MISVFGRHRQGLKVCHLNAQSLQPKIDEFKKIFVDSQVDVSKTWFS